MKPNPNGEVEPVTGTEARVCADIARRQQLGIRKYGTTVSENPLSLKQWLQHGLEEALDLAVYLKRAIEEIEKEEAEKQAWSESGAVMAEADKLEELIQLKLENPGMTREAALEWAMEMRRLYSQKNGQS